MFNGLDNTVSKDASVRDAIELMSQNHAPAVAVVDSDNSLLGLFTNGDMRHFFLEDGDLATPIVQAMNTDPVCFRSENEINYARKNHPYIVYPLVDKDKKLLLLAFNSEDDVMMSEDALKDVPLVIMAGGKGTRLYPYTRILPKALVPIGDTSIAERIIDQFYSRGCRDVWFVLNHKADMVKSYFEGLGVDYAIHFLLEDESRGTGGGLGLLKGRIDSTFIVSNCDILVEDDLACAYETHRKLGDDITYVSAMVNTSIPYGVIETNEEGYVVGLKEKPEFSFLVSTGVYIVEPHVLDYIEPNEALDFPDIVKRCMRDGGKVGVFPVPESSWIDIGELNKMQMAAQRLEARS